MDNRRQFFKIRAASLTVLASVSLISGVWSLLNFGNDRAVSSHIVGSKSLNSVHDLGEKEEICRAANSPNHSLVIVVQGQIFDVDSYPNFFQTADENYGIRAEISEGIAGLVVATDSRTFVGLPVGPVQANKKFKMTIRISQNQFAAGSIDEASSVTVESKLAPKCDRVLVGGGFSKDRAANGRFRVDFWDESYRYHPEFLRLLRTIAMVSAVLFFIVWARKSPLDGEGMKRTI